MSHGPIAQEILLAKIESTYGTDSVPVAGTNAVLVRQVDYAIEGLRMVDRANVQAELGSRQNIYAGRMGSCTFEVEVKGSGVAGTAPEIGPLLRAAGMGEVIVASTSVTYAPASTGIPSLSAYFFANHGAGAVRMILLGARVAEFTMSFKTGGILVARIKLMGKVGAVSDQALPTPTFNQTVPRGLYALPTQINAVSGLLIQDYDFSLNNQVATPDSITDAEGYGNVTILKRDPVVVVRKHLDPLATLNSWTLMTAGTPFVFTSGLLGSVAGNRIQLNCPQCHIRNIELPETAGFRGETLTIGCHTGSTPDTDYNLVFT